jgi:hypothetical protein
MNPTVRRSLSVFVVLIMLPPVLSGCGESGKTVWVTGKLLKGGAKYVPPQGQHVSITFVLLENHDKSGGKAESGEAYFAEVDQENATFSVPGPERGGIPPGKYRIAITQKLTRETFNSVNKSRKPMRDGPGPNREADTLGNRFGLETSPIIREVDQDQEVVIDLDRPTEPPSS